MPRYEKILFLNPIVWLNGKKHAHYYRNWCGGETPGSIAFPPIDLVSAATLLRSEGFNVALIDANAMHLSQREMIGKIIDFEPDLLAVPSAWGSFTYDIKLFESVKKELPETAIALSGPVEKIRPESRVSWRFP